MTKEESKVICDTNLFWFPFFLFSSLYAPRYNTRYTIYDILYTNKLASIF
jgi:hypothetical protein